MGKARIDWNFAAITVIPTVIIGSLFSMMGYEAYQMRPYESNAPAESIDMNGRQFSIIDPETVMRKGNTNELIHNFNLARKTVLIHDGVIHDEFGNEGFKGHETLESFGRPQEFEEARQAGCTMAKRTYVYANNYDPGAYIGDNEAKSMRVDAEKSLAFIKTFCPAAP